MYATSSASGVYHLLNETRDWTLCEQRVAPIIINRAANTSTLYLTEIEPHGRKLCEKCEQRKNLKNESPNG